MKTKILLTFFGLSMAAHSAVIVPLLTIHPGEVWTGTLNFDPAMHQYAFGKYEDQLFFSEGYLGQDGNRHRSEALVRPLNEETALYLASPTWMGVECVYTAYISPFPAVYYFSVITLGTTPVDVTDTNLTLLSGGTPSTSTPEPATFFFVVGGLVLIITARWRFRNTKEQ